MCGLVPSLLCTRVDSFWPSFPGPRDRGSVLSAENTGQSQQLLSQWGGIWVGTVLGSAQVKRLPGSHSFLLSLFPTSADWMLSVCSTQERKEELVPARGLEELMLREKTC